MIDWKSLPRSARRNLTIVVNALGAIIAAVLVILLLDLLLRIADFSHFGLWILPIVILAGAVGGLLAWRRSRPPAGNRPDGHQKLETPRWLPARRWVEARTRDSDLSAGVVNSMNSSLQLKRLFHRALDAGDFAEADLLLARLTAEHPQEATWGATARRQLSRARRRFE